MDNVEEVVIRSLLSIKSIEEQAQSLFVGWDRQDELELNLAFHKYGLNVNSLLSFKENIVEKKKEYEQINSALKQIAFSQWNPLIELLKSQDEEAICIGSFLEKFFHLEHTGFTVQELEDLHEEIYGSIGSLYDASDHELDYARDVYLCSTFFQRYVAYWNTIDIEIPNSISSLGSGSLIKDKKEALILYCLAYAMEASTSISLPCFTESF